MGIALVGIVVSFGGSTPGPVYTVVRGDSLSAIALREGRSVAELREWNGISGDLIEVGQVLTVGPPAQGVRTTAVESLRRRAAPLLRRLKVWATESGGEADENAQQQSSGAAEEIVPDGKRGHRPRSVRVHRKQGKGVAPNGLQAGEQEPLSEEPTWPPLRMPAARPCLAADEGIEQESFGRSQGLDAEQISAATRAFQEQTLRCYQGREGAEGEVLIRLVVGCDGRVLRSQVAGDDTGMEGFAECVADVMRYAAFPAHARDEVEVVVPLQFVADTGAP